MAVQIQSTSWAIISYLILRNDVVRQIVFVNSGMSKIKILIHYMITKCGKKSWRRQVKVKLKQEYYSSKLNKHSTIKLFLKVIKKYYSKCN